MRFVKHMKVWSKRCENLPVYQMMYAESKKMNIPKVIENDLINYSRQLPTYKGVVKVAIKWQVYQMIHAVSKDENDKSN